MNNYPSQELIKQLLSNHARIGQNVYIGLNVFIEIENALFLTIEDDVTISAHSEIIMHDSSLNNITGFDIAYGDVILRQSCYIGASTLILPDTEIGENSIIGAGSLVKGNIKANSLYYGRPAKYQCSIAELEKKWAAYKSEGNPHRYFISTPSFSNRTEKDRIDLELAKRSIKNIPPPKMRKRDRLHDLLNKYFPKI